MTDKKAGAATARKNVAASRKAAVKHEAAAIETNSSLKAPSEAEAAAAQREGIRDAIKESAHDTYDALTDGNLPGEPPARQFTGMDDIMQFEPILDLDPDGFEARVAEDADPALPEEKAAGLLSLERAGRNRTPYVQALMKRLKIDHPGEVTNAGPGYTNDIHPISKL